MAHNGGYAGVNLWFTTLEANYPFMNIAKCGPGLVSIDNTTPFDATKLDSNGYMHTTYGFGQYNIHKIPIESERPGNYVCWWTGNGTIYAPWCTVLTGSKTATSGSGRFTCSLDSNSNTGNFSFGVFSVGSAGTDYPHDIYLCHEDDEAALLLDPYAFGTKFKQTLIDAKIGTIRFMDAMAINDSTWRDWSHRKQLSARSWASSEYPAAIYAGATTNSGDDYSASLSGFSLTDGAQVIVKFNASASSNTCTINVEGTGAVKLSNHYGGLLTSTLRPAINKTGVITYSAGLNRWMLRGGNTFDGTQGISTGWPIELMVKLANEIEAHPWLNIPHLAFEPTSTIATEIADYCRLNLNAGLVPKFEPSNEVWNNVFGQTQFAYYKQLTRDATFQGDWASSTAYSVGDGVLNTINDGRYIAYICRRAHTSGAASSPGNATAWAASTAYVTGDAVKASSSDFQVYLCLTDHTSGSSFTTDLNAGKWAQAWEWQFNAHDWMGRSASILGKAVSAVYSDDRTKYDSITSFQMYGGVTGTPLRRLESTGYVAETGNASDAAKNWVTAMAAALYVRPTLHSTATETTMANEYATASDSRKIELVDEYAAGETSGGDGQAWANAVTVLDNFAACAVTYSITPTLYEQGYEAVTESGSANVIAFRKASKFSTVLHWITQKRLAYEVSKGFEFPCHYVFTTAATWGLIAPTIYNTETGSWTGISNYNSGIIRYLLAAS